MHLLELTKSAWNAQFSADMTEAEGKMIKERVGSFLSMSRKVLGIYGPEGGEGGPISEIEVLENLLSEK
jgi:SET and MYND domain-containing protein